MNVFRSASLLAATTVALVPLIAAAQPAAPAAQTPLGPPIPGICVFARDAAASGSKAGRATDARLRQLGAQVQAELNPQAQSLRQENTTILSLPAAQRPARAEALQKRAATFDQLQQLRTAQLQQTRNKALTTILARMNEVLGPIASGHHCSLILERSTTYGSNPAMDITLPVVTALDARLPTMTFDLEPPTAVKR